MKQIFTLILLIAIRTICFGQNKNVIGTFSDDEMYTNLTITFNSDSTFIYQSTLNPNGYTWEREGFYEKGVWKSISDTIILNPELPKRSFSNHEFLEQESNEKSKIQLTFNHIKNYFDENGKLIKVDTTQISPLDFAINKNKKKNRSRVAVRRTTRCAFAGYIPKEIITTQRTIYIEKPLEKLEKIYIGCYELQGTVEFIIKNLNSNKLTLNIFSNFYQNAQIGQVKYLIKNENSIYIKQKSNGEFQKIALFPEEIIIKRQKNKNKKDF